MCDTEASVTFSYAGSIAKLGCYLNDEQELAFRNSLPAECCCKCKFWFEHDGASFDRDWSEVCGQAIIHYVGDCRRHAPRAMEHEELENDFPW